ncbi:hypothetical protein, unlikely [Trypanosoma brucei gambiense DAL972]|uniref:Uncharacterized protein n=1 Tax=Trypanosoma brucei gambiense (strain MHOM/CI/86/DAL972) TaxID=679716 RepID=C9ZV30_TRYB9|nr:hypothetical protein, unlikely [Trypanosoma brucei gambiense DAL972]CBH13268.1 hypothetical protein, unlikely [Trypanosoma brucei gambiense DAL972]|eukprot:XP_011775545.1 hypothetical protein, unlikely [Trypanosoma brucei gambiense DAL972]
MRHVDLTTWHDIPSVFLLAQIGCCRLLLMRPKQTHKKRKIKPPSQGLFRGRWGVRRKEWGKKNICMAALMSGVRNRALGPMLCYSRCIFFHLFICVRTSTPR